MRSRATRFRAAVILGCILGTLVLVSGWSRPSLKAQFGGVSEVGRLDVTYAPSAHTLKVRVGLASGIALTYEAAGEREHEPLLRMAQIFAQGRSRLLVDVQGGEIRAFQISVP